MTLVVSAGLAAADLPQNYPAWWNQRGVIAPDGDHSVSANYEPVAIGQAKWMAKKALEEMNARLAPFGGAGFTVTDLFPEAPPRGEDGSPERAAYDAWVRANYDTLNLGQLKRIAKPFLTRLNRINYVGKPIPNTRARGYSWTLTTTDDDNYAPANLGQLKYAFCWDLANFTPDPRLDADADGLPDAWETSTGLNPFSSTDGANADTDGDGIVNGLDAAPKNPSIGAFSVSIAYPVAGSNVPAQ